MQRFADHPADLPNVVENHDGWMSDQEIAVLAGFAVLVGGDVLEVGCYRGRSTSALAHAARVTVVDTFRGGGDLPAEDDIREMFDRNLGALRLLDRVEVIAGDSRTVLPALKVDGRRFALALVDGDHTMEACLADIRNAWALLDEGGYLFIDDADWPPVVSAITAWMCDNGRVPQVHIASRNAMNTGPKLVYVRKLQGLPT